MQNHDLSTQEKHAPKGVLIDLVLIHLDNGVLASSVLREEVCVLAKTAAEAQAKFHGLCAKILSEDAEYFGPVLEGGRTRVFRCELSSYLSGRFVPFEVELLGIVGRLSEGPTGQRVFLPQLGINFHAGSHEEGLDELVTEFLREQYGLYERLEVLGQSGEEMRWVSHTEEAQTGDVQLIALDVVPKKTKSNRQHEHQESEYPTLESVGVPLHRVLDHKDGSRAWERDAQVEILMRYVSDAFDRSVLIVGEQGVGKTALVHEMTRRIVRSEAPGTLNGKEVWQISGGRLMAGMRFLGQWQERILAVIAEAKASGAILFIENIMEFLDISGKEGGQGLPNLVLPAILSGEVSVIAEARPEQIAQASQQHPRFVRALRRLQVDALSVPQTDLVLENVSFRLGRQHGVRISESGRQKVLELVGRFQTQQALPGPAVELCERVARTHRQEGELDPDSPRRLLGPRQVIDAYAEQTGLPRPLIDPSIRFEVSDVRAFFERAIFDQPGAIESVVDLVTIIRSGLHPPDRPLGSFLFLGPTGVGKTQTALTLAEYLFGDKGRLIRFDMSEFQDAWSAGRLVGRYRGESGDLVKKVREQPFCVVLLDEIEKADRAVFDLLLQALGEGRLTDGHGQTVSLCNTVFIMTSNLGGSQGGTASRVGFQKVGAGVNDASYMLHYQRAVEQFFRPEFVGRIDRVIPFLALTQKTAHKLVSKTLEQAFSREGLVRRRIVASASEEVMEFLIQEGFDPRYGARPLRQAVEVYITAPLAEFLASQKGVEDVKVRFEMGEDVPKVHVVE